MIQRICGVDVSVEHSDPTIWATNGMGRCEQKQARIFLCAGLPVDVTNSTNLHEVIHMVLDMNGFSDHANQEQLVSVLGSSLFAWMRDNRQMLQSWIYGWDNSTEEQK